MLFGNWYLWTHMHRKENTDWNEGRVTNFGQFLCEYPMVIVWIISKILVSIVSYSMQKHRIIKKKFSDHYNREKKYD